MYNFIVPKQIKKAKNQKLRSMVAYFVSVGIAIMFAGIVSFKLYLSTLPPINNLEEFRPNIITKFYSSDGEIIKTFTLGSSLDFTSSINNTEFIFCDSKTFYYVLKDENGNNHNEIKLSLEDSLKIFNPILSTYFIKQLASFMYK